jgi:lytic murein transglycosylase
MAMMQVKAGALLVVIQLALAAFAAPAWAADCGDTPDGFKAWLETFRQVAINDGISPQVVDNAFGSVTFDPSVLSHDRGQRGWQGESNFASFISAHVTSGRIKRGKMMMLAFAEPLERIEKRYGVPGAVLVAIWGLETDFGTGLGKYPTFSALATLAYDCRRADLYRSELIDALMIVQRGLLSPQEMRGAWAGELGQTQLMPSAYLKFGVTSAGERGGDLMSNSADALASTANFLQQHGWQRQASWDPGEPNFATLLEWNKAEVYARTIAEFADRLAE